jgi:hypothetical protein
VIPLWFEAGFTLYEPAKWSGIHGNLLDVHPIHAIRPVAAKKATR